MTRKIIPILVALALGYPQGAPALALGDLKVRSSLNEPFNAEIDLLSVRGDDLADLRAKLASPEEFLRAGVERPYVLSRLRFKVEERPGGKAVLKISTRQPVKEPFLNFLLEMNWPQGRVVREYTALLDPPVYAAAATARVQGPVVRATPEPLPPALEMPVAEGAGRPEPAKVVEVQPPPAAVAGEPKAASEGAKAAPPAPQPKSGGAESYGPTRSGDTLWSIANRVRPDASVSTQQMMVALLQANPDAFAMGNVNALKSGYVLRVPDRGSLDAVTHAQALADLRRQQTAWEDYRQGAARTARPAPTAVAAAAPARKPVAEPAPAPVAVAPQSRLELVAAGTEEGSGTRRGGGTTALKRELTVLQEDLDGRRREIAELQSRLAEAEALIQDLQRLIKLKDETLSALQQQALVAQAKAEEPVATEPVPVPAPAPVVEPLPAGTPAGEAGSTTAPEARANAAEPEPNPVPETPPVPAPVAPVAPVPAETASAPVAPAPAASAPVAPAPAASAPVAPAPAAPAPAASAPVAPPPAAPAPAAPSEVAPAPAPTLSEVASQKAQAAMKSVSENPTVFWGGLAGLLALVGGLFSVRRRRPSEESPGPAAVTRPDEPSTAVVSAVPRAAAPSVTTVAHPTFVEPVEEPVIESPTAEVRPEDSRAEDPMAEVNVYLAYERFSQAEELVREAIAAQPDRPEYRLKLLEVHHAAKNPAGFERDAAALRDAVGEGSPLMGRARSWWSDLSPGRALFAPAAVAAAVMAPAMAPGVGGPDFERTLKLSAEDIQSALDLGRETEAAAGEPAAEGLDLGSGAVDFDLGLMGAEEPSSESVDFDLDLGLPHTTTEKVAVPSGVDRPVSEADDSAIAAALAEATEALDLDLGEGPEAAPAEPESSLLDFELEAPSPTLAPTQKLVEPSPAVPVSAEPSVDLRLEPMSVSTRGTPLAAGVGPAAPVSGPAEPPSLDLALEPLDLPAPAARPSEGVPDEVLQSLTPRDSSAAVSVGRQTARRAGQAVPEVDFELDLDVSGGEPDEASFFLDGEALGSLDEVGTKLDLARAYIDMGDTEGARGILGEVLSEGNDTQQGEARELLARLAS
jgi:pilus assembly protein FimV